MVTKNDIHQIPSTNNQINSNFQKSNLVLGIAHSLVIVIWELDNGI